MVPAVRQANVAIIKEEPLSWHMAGRSSTPLGGTPSILTTVFMLHGRAADLFFQCICSFVSQSNYYLTQAGQEGCRHLSHPHLALH